MNDNVQFQLLETEATTVTVPWTWAQVKWTDEKYLYHSENICRRVGARPLHQLPDAEQHAGGGAPRQHRQAALQGPQAAQQRHGQWICIAFYHSFNN